MRRSVALLLSITLLSGCSVFARRHRALGVTGDLIGIGGLIVIADQRNCDATFPSEYNDCKDYNHGRVQLGSAIVAVGVVLGLAAIGWTMYDDAKHPGYQDPVPHTETQGESHEAPGYVEHSDPELDQLGKQAWRAAVRGDCSVCLSVLARIGERDAAYRDRLATSPSIAECSP